MEVNWRQEQLIALYTRTFNHVVEEILCYFVARIPAERITSFSEAHTIAHTGVKVVLYGVGQVNPNDLPYLNSAVLDYTRSHPGPDLNPHRNNILVRFLAYLTQQVHFADHAYPMTVRNIASHLLKRLPANSNVTADQAHAIAQACCRGENYHHDQVTFDVTPFLAQAVNDNNNNSTNLLIWLSAGQQIQFRPFVRGTPSVQGATPSLVIPHDRKRALSTQNENTDTAAKKPKDTDNDQDSPMNEL